MYETLEIAIDKHGVATLWLDRADKHNAISAQMIAELSQAAAALAGDDKVRVVVLAGRGKSFCAGGDLGWMRAQMDADPGTRAREATALARMLQVLNTLPKPLVARMGEARARRVFMSGRRFAAAEAVDLGVLAKAVPVENLDDVVWAEIEPYLSCAPAAVARAKALLRNLGPVIDETVIQHSISELAACWAGGEAPEGIAAFFDKRPPIWD